MRRRLAMAGIVSLACLADSFAGTLDLSFCVEKQGNFTGYYNDECAQCPAMDDPCTEENEAGIPTLYLAPYDQVAYFMYGCSYDFCPEWHQGSLVLKMAVNASGGGGCGEETIDSIGLSVNGFRATGTATLAADDFAFFNTPAETGAANAPWTSISTLGSGGTAPDEPLIGNAHAYSEPGAESALLWNSYCPGGSSFPDGEFAVGRLVVTAGYSDLPHEPQADFDLHMAVGDGLITRAFLPGSPEGTVPEDVSFGYADGSPEQGVPGDEVGASSETPDCRVVIRRKGDFGSTDPNTGNFLVTPDGFVGSDDIAGFIEALYGVTCMVDITGEVLPERLIVFLGDFGATDPNVGEMYPTPDCLVGSDDITFFLAALQEP